MRRKNGIQPVNHPIHQPLWGHFTSQIGVYTIIPNNKPLLVMVCYWELYTALIWDLTNNLMGISREYHGNMRPTSPTVRCC